MESPRRRGKPGHGLPGNLPPLTRYNLLMARTKNGRRIALLSGVVVIAVIAPLVWANWERIRFFVQFESLGKNVQGYREYRQRQTGIVFVSLPGGEFEMGTSKEDAERILEDVVKKFHLDDAHKKSIAKPLSHEALHKVTLSPFLIAKYEVSQAEWERVMEENPSHFKGDDLPVGLSWQQCQKFCAKTGLLLPTEAQWEYSCRGGTVGDFAGEIVEIGWCASNLKKTYPVGQKKPNAFGLHDMHGNVSEWCQDVYLDKFYRLPQALGLDPVCHLRDGDHVVRGGNRNYHAWLCRSAWREPGEKRGGDRDLTGFRPAWSWP